jgi:hypothetical protein
MTEKTLREEIAKLAKDCRSFVEPKPGTYLRGRHDACLSIADTLDALLARHPEPARALAAPPDEDVARLINGLVEAGDLLYGHVQRIAWDPAAANMARECWLESRAALSGDHEPKYVAPPAPGTTAATPPKEDRHE